MTQVCGAALVGDLDEEPPPWPLIERGGNVKPAGWGQFLGDEHDAPGEKHQSEQTDPGSGSAAWWSGWLGGDLSGVGGEQAHRNRRCRPGLNPPVSSSDRAM